jgi:hypothetical protein
MKNQKNNKAFAENMLKGKTADKANNEEVGVADDMAPSAPTPSKSVEKLKTSEVTLNQDITAAIRNMEGIMALKLIDIDLRMRQSNEYLESIDRLTEDSKIQLDEIYQLLDMSEKNALNTDAQKLEPSISNGDDQLTEYLKDNNFLPVKIMNPEELGGGGGIGGAIGNIAGGAMGAMTLRGVATGALRLLGTAAAIVATPEVLIGAAILAATAAVGYGAYKTFIEDPGGGSTQDRFAGNPGAKDANKSLIMDLQYRAKERQRYREEFGSSDANPENRDRQGYDLKAMEWASQVSTTSTSPVGQSSTIPMNNDTPVNDDAQLLSSGNAVGLGESGSASEALAYFRSKGWTYAQAAGIVGNLQQESGQNLQTNAVGDGGKAYGIAQWHPDRQAFFEQEYGKPIQQSTFKEQLEFVNWELNNTESRAAGKLAATQTVEEAAAAFDEYYERSAGTPNPGIGGVDVDKRIANALALAGAITNTDASKTQSTSGPHGHDALSPSGAMTPPAAGAAGLLSSSMNGFSSMATAGKLAGNLIGDLSKKTTMKTAAPDVAPTATGGAGGSLSSVNPMQQSSKPATAGSSNPLAAIDNMFAKLFDESAMFG